MASPIIISCWRILSKTAFRLFLITFTEPGVRHYFNCFKLSLTSSIIYYWECYTQKTSADCATTKKLLVSLIKFLHKCILHSSWYHVIECSCLIMNDYINFSEFVQIQVTHSLKDYPPYGICNYTKSQSYNRINTFCEYILPHFVVIFLPVRDELKYNW